MQTDKNAIFVAGDEGIFFPAIVALDSILQHNPGLYDAYMCFDSSKLTDEMVKALSHHRITFIDAADLNISDRLEQLPKMQEGRWPIEIMYNWALPEHLGKLGYEYSIKVDYDVLCIGEYITEEVLPLTAIARGLVFDIDLQKEGISHPTILSASSSLLYKPGTRSYINAGFVSFNNKLCSKERFFDKIINAYSFIATQNPGAKLIEQLALHFVLSTIPGGVEELASKYNHRVRYGILVDEDLNPTAKNIHYITSLKPWKPFNRKDVRSFVNGRQGILFSYRALWLERASKSPWFSIFCSEKPMSHEQSLGLSIIVAHNYNQRLLQLESEIKDLKSKI